MTKITKTVFCVASFVFLNILGSSLISAGLLSALGFEDPAPGEDDLGKGVVAMSAFISTAILSSPLWAYLSVKLVVNYKAINSLRDSNPQTITLRTRGPMALTGQPKPRFFAVFVGEQYYRDV
jgi:hypothetical protein